MILSCWLFLLFPRSWWVTVTENAFISLVGLTDFLFFSTLLLNFRASNDDLEAIFVLIFFERDCLTVVFSIFSIEDWIVSYIVSKTWGTACVTSTDCIGGDLYRDWASLVSCILRSTKETFSILDSWVLYCSPLLIRFYLSCRKDPSGLITFTKLGSWYLLFSSL